MAGLSGQATVGRRAGSPGQSQDHSIEHTPGTNKFTINGIRYSLVYKSNKAPVQFDSITPENQARIQAVEAIAQAVFPRGSGFPPTTTTILTRERATLREGGQDVPAEYDGTTTLDQEAYATLQGRVSQLTQELSPFEELRREGGGGDDAERVHLAHEDGAAAAAGAPSPQEVIVPHRVAMEAIFDILESIKTTRSGADDDAVSLRGQLGLNSAFEVRGNAPVWAQPPAPPPNPDADDDSGSAAGSPASVTDDAGRPEAAPHSTSAEQPGRAGSEAAAQRHRWRSPSRWLQARREAAAAAKERDHVAIEAQIDADLLQFHVLSQELRGSRVARMALQLHNDRHPENRYDNILEFFGALAIEVWTVDLGKDKSLLGLDQDSFRLPRDHPYLQRLITRMEEYRN